MSWHPSLIWIIDRSAVRAKVIRMEVCYSSNGYLTLLTPQSVPTQLLTHHGLSEEIASAYLQSTLKLSTDALGIPLALNVMWKVSCMRKLLPVPCPMMRKLLMNVSSTPTLALNSS
jgi:hypothetical protein